MRQFTRDSAWIAKICPVCAKKLAVGHGWVFADPMPDLIKRKHEAIEEWFLHLHEGGLP